MAVAGGGGPAGWEQFAEAAAAMTGRVALEETAKRLSASAYAGAAAVLQRLRLKARGEEHYLGRALDRLERDPTSERRVLELAGAIEDAGDRDEQFKADLTVDVKQALSNEELKQTIKHLRGRDMVAANISQQGRSPRARVTNRPVTVHNRVINNYGRASSDEVDLVAYWGPRAVVVVVFLAASLWPSAILNTCIRGDCMLPAIEHLLQGLFGTSLVAFNGGSWRTPSIHWPSQYAEYIGGWVLYYALWAIFAVGLIVLGLVIYSRLEPKLLEWGFVRGAAKDLS